MRVTKPGSPIVLFIDWRQLPSLTDALQWAGWSWNGIVPWDKRTARPRLGGFRQQCEFILWGYNGKMPNQSEVGYLPGIFSYSFVPPNMRKHQTEKPLDLMRELVKIVRPGGRILDPFAGSGTTLEAARVEGYDAVGIELSEVYCKIAIDRLNLDKDLETALQITDI